MPNNMFDKARNAQWGYLDFERGRILCIQISDDKVILVEPDAGYFFPMPGEVKSTPMPDVDTIISTITAIKVEDLDSFKVYCSEPRTMKEVEDQFPNIQAWRLRKLGVLKDTGRRGRTIVSIWAGYDLNKLLEYIFNQENKPTRNVNNPML